MLVVEQPEDEEHSICNYLRRMLHVAIFNLHTASIKFVLLLHISFCKRNNVMRFFFFVFFLRTKNKKSDKYSSIDSYFS